MHQVLAETIILTSCGRWAQGPMWPFAALLRWGQHWHQCSLPAFSHGARRYRHACWDRVDHKQRLHTI